MLDKRLIDPFICRMKMSFTRIAFLLAFTLAIISSKAMACMLSPGLFAGAMTENAILPAQPDSFIVILGRWKVTRFINGDVTTMSDDKVVKMTMDKTFLFTWRMSVVLSDTCTTPVYDAQRYNKAEFLSKYLGQESDLGIKGDSINIVRIRCSGRTVYRGNIPANNYYYRFIILDDQSLIMPFKGNFLLLNRVNEKSKSAIVAVQKPAPVPAEVKEANANKPAAKAPAITNPFKYSGGNNDPFHIFTDLVNSAIQLMETNNQKK